MKAYETSGPGTPGPCILLYFLNWDIHVSEVHKNVMQGVGAYVYNIMYAYLINLNQMLLKIVIRCKINSRTLNCPTSLNQPN